MLNQNFVILAAALNLYGSASYVIETLKGKTKPNRVTWFIWALAPLIAFAAMASEGVGLSALMTFMVGFGPLAVFVASFINRKSYWKISKLDIICGLLSLTALIVWGLTRTGIIAIALSISADGLAAIPTVIKSWKAPETEDYRVFLYSTVSAVITMLTLTSWGFANSGFPIYIFLICLILTLLIAFPKLRPFRNSTTTA
ncbi:MAG: hypothetical protein AAB424_02510 [Patescibacteria group bacterium]